MDLSRAVLVLHSRGVTVRVLSDKDYIAITGSQIGVLRKAGKDSSVCLMMHSHDDEASPRLYRDIKKLH